MKGNVTPKFNPMHLVYMNTIASAIKYIESVPQLQKYIEKLRVFEKNIINNLVDVFTKDETSFNVLNHGDLWINNLMFKADDSDVLLVSDKWLII